MKVLKVGGSVLTDKEERESLREKELKRVASELASKPDELVLVHGAGSFGHPHVDEHFSGGGHERLLGAADSHRAVSELTHRVVASLVSREVHALPVRPLSCGTAEDGSLVDVYLEPVTRMLEADVLPVLHGDVVMSRGDVTVVSGDEVAVRVAEELGAEKVGFGTDVGGVLGPGGEVLERLERGYLDEVEFFEGSGTDITGGMEGKVLSLMRSNMEGVIFSASEPGNVEGFLKGESLGTEVLP